MVCESIGTVPHAGQEPGLPHTLHRMPEALWQAQGVLYLRRRLWAGLLKICQKALPRRGKRSCRAVSAFVSVARATRVFLGVQVALQGMPGNGGA